jgi:hypothetical protein
MCPGDFVLFDKGDKSESPRCKSGECERIDMVGLPRQGNRRRVAAFRVSVVAQKQLMRMDVGPSAAPPRL